jgi:hypothetical protein
LKPKPILSFIRIGKKASEIESDKTYLGTLDSDKTNWFVPICCLTAQGAKAITVNVAGLFANVN